jgi:hypothetical protein
LPAASVSTPDGKAFLQTTGLSPTSNSGWISSTLGRTSSMAIQSVNDLL